MVLSSHHIQKFFLKYIICILHLLTKSSGISDIVINLLLLLKNYFSFYLPLNIPAKSHVLKYILCLFLCMEFSNLNLQTQFFLIFSRILIHIFVNISQIFIFNLNKWTVFSKHYVYYLISVLMSAWCLKKQTISLIYPKFWNNLHIGQNK